MRKFGNYNQLVDHLHKKIKDFYKDPESHSLDYIDVSNQESLVSLFDHRQEYIRDAMPKVEIDIFTVQEQGVLPKEFFKGIETWNTKRLVNGNYMFRGQRHLDLDLSKWKLPSLMFAKEMFAYCENLNCSFNESEVNIIEDMEGMFRGCVKLNKPFYKWKTSRLKNSRRAFADCYSLNQDFNDWDISSLQNCVEMFIRCSSLEDGISKWNLDYSLGIDYDGILGYCEKNINV